MSRQTTLGDDEGVAAELAEAQRAISIAEFFEKNKQMLGFDSGAKALVTAVKEGVDNSLTRSTPFVYRRGGETIHRSIGPAIDELIEANPGDTEHERGGDLQKLRLDDLDTDLEALSFSADDGADYDVDFRRIGTVFRHRVNSDIYRIAIEGGREVELTDYHSVFVLRDGEVVSVETSDIDEGDCVVLPDTAWDGGDVQRIDLVTELMALPPERTEPIDLHGVEHLLEEHDDAIREADAGYRTGDFRKCDRLPFNLVRELDLGVDDYAECEIGYRYGDSVPAVLSVDEDLAELLGIYTAEGCVTGSEHEKAYLSLGAHETDLIARTERLIESVFGLEPSTVAANESGTNVTVPAKIVGLLFEDVFDAGAGASGKRIPRYVFDFPRDLRERFLLGYAAGDGYPTSSVVAALEDGDGSAEIDENRIALSTASDRLSSGLRYLLSSIGYDATHDHALALADGGTLEFAGDGRATAAGDLTALPVTAVERVDYDGEWVYDVSVPGHENFMAGTAPLACHNSLDATEEAGILPDVYVELEDLGDYYRLVVEDNGPGITREQVPKVFGKLLYGSRFHAREQSLLPDQQVLVRRNGEVELVGIGELCDAYIPDPEGDRSVPVGDDVEAPCFDRETGEIAWREVTHAIRHRTRNDTYRVETSRGRSIEVTGNHSLFSAGPDGIEEVAAADLSPGDHVLAPERVPAPEDATEINLLEQIPRSELADRDWDVYGVGAETIREVAERDERVRKPANNYLEKGSLPADVIVDLGWEDRVADGTIRTSRGDGTSGETPVTVPLTEGFVESLGRYVAGTGATARDAVDAGTAATATTTGATTTAILTPFGRLDDPLAVFAAHACGRGSKRSETGRVPPVVFRAPSELQRAFLEGVYDADVDGGSSGAHATAGENPCPCYATAGERLARELSYLWTMQGATASVERADATGGDGSTPRYRVRVRGADTETSTAHDAGDSDLASLRVESVDPVDPPEYVYDLSVPGTGGDENFVAGNRGAICVKNSRGQQGIGISAAVLYAQLTSGKPARVTSKTAGGEARRYELTIDTDANEPEIEADDPTTWERPHGTRIELEMEGNMRARTQLHDYVLYTAVVNPHARITFDEPGLEEPMVFERATDELPAETEEIRPHPHGVELGTLQKMLASTESYSVSGFLRGEFARVGGKTADELVDNFRDRHFGREMVWHPPEPGDEVAVESAVADATANKRREATADFAAGVEERLEGPVAHGDVIAAVDEAADAVETDHGTTFGDTVRGNAVDAAWAAITADRRSELYRLVDGATTSRKDDAAIEAMARRIATRFDDGARAGEEAEAAENPRDRATREMLAEWVAWAAERTADREGESFGETAREKIVDAIWERARTVDDEPPRVSEIEADRDTAARLLEAMRETDVLAPPTDCLAPITAELLDAGLRKEFDADFYAATTRDADVHGGDPFVAEAGIAYGGELSEGGNVDVLRFANRVPLVYQLGACATTDVLKRINWRNYGLDQPGGSGMPGGPAVVAVHVASTNVPFTSESKDAVANVEEIEDEIELALREVGRELKSYRNRQQSLAKRREKRDVIAEVLPRMAEKLTEMTGNEPLNVDDSLARIMNNVLVERTVEDGEVTLAIHNHDGTAVSPAVTEIVSREPVDPDPEGATVVEMDGEWFLKWSPDVPAGERATLTYGVPDDAEFGLSVDDVPAEKLTVNA